MTAIVCYRCKTPEIQGKIYTKVDGNWICDGCYTGGVDPGLEAGRKLFEMLKWVLKRD